MIRFIWQNWWRRKERFILLIIGAFIVSAGLTYLIGLSETNKGTIVDTLQQRWSASYDIVVRPEGTRSVTEEKKLLEPNYLSGLSGGISVEQYEAIKDIPGVEVAAPIAMIGYADYEVHFGYVELPEDGIYRRVMETTVDNGINKITETGNSYFVSDIWDYMNKGAEYGVGKPSLDLSVHSYSLLAGIDPEQEAKLVGLDESIIPLGTSRYFNESDEYYYNEFNGGHHEFPIIVNQQTFVDKVESITFERLNISVNKENVIEVMERVKESGGGEYLDSVEGEIVETFSYTGEEAFRKFINEKTGVDWETGEPLPDEEDKSEGEPEGIVGNSSEDNITGMVFKPSPLEYQEIASPYADRWPYTYQVIPFQNGEDTVGRYRNKESFREPVLIEEEFINFPKIKPSWIGFYDASKLSISKDPTTELPMETYRPATAEFVIDMDGNPVNPPKQLKPIGDPNNFLTEPPGMLTTIEVAEQILGDKPISAIRIKVAGVTDLSEDSQKILEQVAAEIESRTGLITDITLGSSPQLALTYVPGLNGDSAIGWFQQPWVNIGSSISIFKETKIGFSGVVASVIVVAIVYVWASGVVNLLARRKEFAVLLSIGWRPGQLSRLLFLESSMIGAFVALISWMMLSFVYISSDATISLSRFLWTGLFGLIVYVLGSVIPMLLTRNISPYEAMRTGEISGTSKRIFQARGIHRMAFNHFIGKWKRSVLSVISIALPTALLAVFLYITFRLRGIMYTSLLGEYVALEIGPAHYVAIIVSLVIAILTTAEITWQNVSERREEISLLQAIGWKGWHIRRLILAEGVFSGLFAAVIGLSAAFLMMWGLYGAFPSEEIAFILATGLIPIIIGLIGTVLPAERAVRIVPNQGIAGNYSNRKVTEKRMKLVVISTAVVLVGTFLITMIKVAPNIEMAEKGTEVEYAFSPTEGDVKAKETVEQVEPDEPEESNPGVRITDKVKGNFFEVLNEGENTTDKGSWILSYSATEVESNLPPAEAGMKNIAIEFTFEVLDDSPFSVYQMLPEIQFTIVVDEEKYYPENVTILEVEGWDEEKWLNGKMHAILDYTVPEDVEDFGFLLRSNGFMDGILVWFEREKESS
ncbi:FtsX-like permease family protein [Ornithinibacillus californiensis]|uniref:FtsX-like permease family protein n=1 Tax=Ornithinibacillus californiensis TaxID=161536 RepID=UPI00069E5B19|nr:FtsX-like permease family protein [Ornithinibacillus californiensis]